MNTFNFIGYLKPIKDSDKFKGFNITNFDSGWMNERLVFNVIAGDNRHMVEINAGRWKQEEKNIIYGFTKGENGNKGETTKIPWSKRNDPDEIEKMAGWKVFTVDTETTKHRNELKENGDTEALEAANKKRRHFLAGTEFCEYVNKLVNSEKAKTMKFCVKGNITYKYSEKNDMYYSAYEVNKIYRVDDETDPTSDVNIDFYFTENAMDSSNYDETGKAIVSGYTTYYDPSTKKNWFCPINLAMRFGNESDAMERIEYWNDIFSEFDNDLVRYVGLNCQQINGAQKVQATYDDLSDKAKRAIKMGAKKLEDALREVGGSVYGDNIQEIRVTGFGRGFSGSETTDYTIEKLTQKPFKETLVFDEDDDEL